MDLAGRGHLFHERAAGKFEGEVGAQLQDPASVWTAVTVLLDTCQVHQNIIQIKNKQCKNECGASF